MKKSPIIIIVLSLAAMASILIVSSKNQNRTTFPIEEGQLIFRMADHRIDSYPSNKGVREFARLVEEKTEGQIKILVYDQNTLFTESNIVEQIAFGGIDFGRVSSLYLAEYVPLMETLLKPNLFKDKEEMMSVINNKQINIVLKEAFKNEKINVLAWYPGSQRGIYHVKDSLFDLVGDKIAVAESQVKIDEVSILGFLAVPSKSENINSYLESNYIQGGEGDLLDYYYNGSYNKAEYFTTTPWSIVPEAIIVSNTAIRKLTMEQQAIIADAANEAALYINDLILEQEKSFMKELIELDVEFHDGFDFIDKKIQNDWDTNNKQEQEEWLLLINEAIKSR